MKMISRISGCLVAAMLLVNSSWSAESTSSDVTPQSVLNVMQRVADWELAHPTVTSRRPATGWVQAAGDAGFMALAGISGDAKYRDAMLQRGETNDWKLGGRLYDADDHCIGQTWAELYLLYRDPKMIQPLRETFDQILANPPKVQSLKFAKKEDAKTRENWSWCDSLFMGPPAWVRLYAAMGDEKYLDYMVTNWWRTTDFLYDQQAHLFFRDGTYFDKREDNGKKIFWSRGNGWVLAGLVRVLEYLPMNHPDRPRFEKLFQEMAASVLNCQQADGLWRTSLLDPESYPLKETSGSGFFTYGLAWGVNQGLLDKTQYAPAVQKAWNALVACVQADGKLTHVQPIGADPKKFAPDSTEVYGVGAFLLAGSEVYRMAVLENAKTVSVSVHNPADFFRKNETVEINRSGKLAVMNGSSSLLVTSQSYQSPDGQEKLLFQTDLSPGETRTFYILPASALAAEPPPIVKTFARYVPERFDDFAWESDRIAFRAYGQALIKAEGTISSGADVWIKKNRGLIVNTMYATKHYHEDNGEFMDDYRCGKSRGCGGLGIWDGKKLFVSSNWKNYKVITTGPIRSEFELTYDTWDAGNGRKVSEVKRFSIDAGSWMTKEVSTLTSDDKSPLTIGVGFAERACPTNRVEFINRDKAEGWETYWQPEDKPKGVTAVAIILPKDSVEKFTNDDPNMPASKKHANVPQPTHEGYPPIRNQLAITQVTPGKPFTFYFGASWDRSGDFTNHVQWENYVSRFAERRDQPLQVTVGN